MSAQVMPSVVRTVKVGDSESETAPLAEKEKEDSFIKKHVITKIRTNPTHKFKGFYPCDEFAYVLLWIIGAFIGAVTVYKICEGTQTLVNSSKFTMKLEDPFEFPPVEICLDLDKDDFSADGGFVISGIDHFTPASLSKAQRKLHKFTTRHLADSHDIDQKTIEKKIDGLQWTSKGFYDPFSMPKKKLKDIVTSPATVKVTNRCDNCDPTIVKGKKTVTEAIAADGYTYPVALVDDDFTLAEWQKKWKYDFDWNVTKTVCIHLNDDSMFKPKKPEDFMGISLLLTATDGMNHLKPYVRINNDQRSISYVANSGLTRVVVSKAQDKFVPFAGHFSAATKPPFNTSYSAMTTSESNWVNDHTQHRCENGGSDFTGETSTESYLGTTQSLWYMPWKEFFDWYCAFQPWVPASAYTKQYDTDEAAIAAGHASAAAANSKYVNLAGSKGVPAGKMPQWSCDPETYDPAWPTTQMAKPYFGTGLLTKLFKVQAADPGWVDKSSLYSMWNLFQPEGKTGLDTVNMLNDYRLVGKLTKGLVTSNSSHLSKDTTVEKKLTVGGVERSVCPKCIYGTDSTCGQVMTIVFSPASMFVPQNTITEMPVKVIADIYIAITSFIMGTMIFVNLMFGIKVKVTNGEMQTTIEPRWTGGPAAMFRRACPWCAKAQKAKKTEAASSE